MYSIKHGVIHLPSKNENYHWLKLKKSFFSLPDDLFICIAHIPPQNSTYTARTGDVVLDDILLDIVKYSKQGSIILSGDLNARTGVKEDYILNDEDDIHMSEQGHYLPDLNIRSRGSQDKTISSRGNSILDMCTGARLRIVNGRTLGDTLGRFTCHNSLGSSVVDYCIVSETLYKHILYFKVHDFEATISDHCQLSLGVKANICRSQCTNFSSVAMAPMPLQFHWSTEAAPRYKKALDDVDAIAKIKSLNDNLLGGNHSVEQYSETLKDILITAAKRSLRPKHDPQKTNKKRKIKSKPWFNNDLHTLKKRIQAGSKQLAKEPGNPFIRGLFYRDLKYYNKIRKKTYRKYKADLLQKLESLEESNPKQFWTLLDKLKNEDQKKGFTSSISNNQWFSHFKDLNSLTQKTAEMQNHYN